MADTELSTACVDRLEATMAKLAAIQTSIVADQTSITSKLDAIIRILNTMVPKQPSPSSASAKSPPMPPLLPKTINPTSSFFSPFSLILFHFHLQLNNIQQKSSNLVPKWSSKYIHTVMNPLTNYTWTNITKPLPPKVTTSKNACFPKTNNEPP